LGKLALLARLRPYDPDMGAQRMTALHPDHQRILELAQAALKARDNRALWRMNVKQAAEEHGYYCDELWRELERQTDDRHGEIPVLEHPSVRMRTMVANIRREIVATAQNAIEEALNELAEGPMMEDYEE
jgi:hypothetical protein